MTSVPGVSRTAQWQKSLQYVTSCQHVSHNRSMLRDVAAVVLNGYAPFEFGVVCEVFGIDRSDEDLPVYDFAVVAGEPGPIWSRNQFSIQTEHGLDRLERADLIALPAMADDTVLPHPPAGPGERPQPREFPEPLLAALRRAADRGTRVLSICSGAFLLGAAGLLDGRHCTTHWRHAGLLARTFPEAKVDPDVLYVDDDPIITSAGTAAGIDACLYLVRKEQGTRVANGIARRMVVPPHRDGGQAQFVCRPVPLASAEAFGDLLEWLPGHLAVPVSVAEMAARAHMSPRTFARRFVQETGTTPQRWLVNQRVLYAQQLLEETGETIDVIAGKTGFGNAAALRHHFREWRGTTPNAYRRMFRGAAG
jgi:transcriptional regulator GlxA family with amidase domain